MNHACNIELLKKLQCLRCISFTFIKFRLIMHIICKYFQYGLFQHKTSLAKEKKIFLWMLSQCTYCFHKLLFQFGGDCSGIIQNVLSVFVVPIKKKNNLHSLFNHCWAKIIKWNASDCISLTLLKLKRGT